MRKFAFELADRFLSDNPKFFKYIQYVSAGIATITGLPGFLAQCGITLPPQALAIENKTIAIASVVAAFIAQLPKQDPLVTPPATPAS